jgi:hypothetical protein
VFFIRDFSFPLAISYLDKSGESLFFAIRGFFQHLDNPADEKQRDVEK